MICDDDRDILKLFGQALSSKYNIILVGSGEDCISKFMELINLGKKIHLLLLDYRLDGGMYGDAVALKIREIYDETRTIMISAYAIDDILVKNLEESNCIAKFVKKPIHLKSLIELVTEIIS
jgi:response regulator RpfG family c-di-GMP phosphodiesterase